jgi:hypothetical protein
MQTFLARTEYMKTMKPSNSPLSAFHQDIRAILGDEDDEVHPAYKLNSAVIAVVNTGKVHGYRIGSDRQSIEPELTPVTDQASYTKLIINTVLLFPKSLTNDQVFELNAEIAQLYGMCDG